MHRSDRWYESVVLSGDRIGRTLGFPTANLDAGVLKDIKKEGVYAAEVHLGSQIYRGALYLGPRIVLGETTRVLEIHLLGFNREIYGETLRFRLGKFIRPPMDFPSREALIKQLQADVAAAQSYIA